jgi:hypothetical protein
MFIGPSKIPAVNSSKKVVTGAWGIPLRIDAFQSSSDASLFSSSLPVLSHEKRMSKALLARCYGFFLITHIFYFEFFWVHAVNFNDSENYGRSIDDSPPNLNNLDLETEVTDLFEDIEPSAIGNLLPDDDELLAGIMDDFDLSGLPSQLEDLEEIDLFGPGGGMELDFESQESLRIGMSKLNMTDGIPANGVGHYALPNGVGTVAGEHPYGEHPSRTLFVRNINSNVEDSELRSLFEVCSQLLECQMSLI